MRVNANALILHQGKILLARFEDDRGPYYTIPGGKIEKHESAQEAVIRECHEETGTEVSIGPLVLVHEYSPKEEDDERFARKRKMSLIFLATLRSSPDQIRMIHPDKEQVAAEWVPLSRLSDALARNEPLLYPRIEKEVLEIAKSGGSATFTPFLSNMN